jgi:hypothetical protein
MATTKGSQRIGSGNLVVIKRTELLVLVPLSTFVSSIGATSQSASCPFMCPGTLTVSFERTLAGVEALTGTWLKS